MKENIYIVSSARTPVGSFNGSLSTLSAPKLGAVAIKAAVERSGLQPKDINEVVMGNVLTAGVGQAPARQAAIFAGLPTSVPCMTINKVCGSGLKAVMLACDSILAGNANAVVAGGQENMSQAPHLLENARSGYRMGNVTAQDSMIKDGLWDPYNNFHMGNAAEICVKDFKFSREEQDEFAVESYKRAQNATKEGHFKTEIATVTIEGRKGTTTVDTDEDVFKLDESKVKTLRAAFEKDGTITAVNASNINDGAAALVVVNEQTLKSKNLKATAKIIASATFAQDPVYFTTAPVGAIKKALDAAKLKVEDIDLWEINEAFSMVTMAAMKELSIPREKVNVEGGAVAIGHPIGGSGARILTTLIHSLQRTNKRYGLATLCIGGGEAVAMIVERQ
ncbi:MAG: thiolase family protein [Bdellovibrionales bacterium]|nr:thiolase family protein [Bdellovibrionales bacterium]